MSDTVVLKLTKAGGNDELDRQAWSQQAAKQLQARHTSAVERSKMNGCSLLVLWTDPIGDQPINGKRPVCMFVLWFFCCLLLCFIPLKLVQLGPLWPNSPWRSCRLHESNGFQFCCPGSTKCQWRTHRRFPEGRQKGCVGGVSFWLKFKDLSRKGDWSDWTRDMQRIWSANLLTNHWLTWRSCFCVAISKDGQGYLQQVTRSDGWERDIFGGTHLVRIYCIFLVTLFQMLRVVWAGMMSYHAQYQQELMFPRLHHSKESQTFPINSLVSTGCMTRKWGAFFPTSWGERGSDFVQRETPGARDTFNSTFLGIGHESKKWWITGQDTLMHSPSSNSCYHQDDHLQSVENPPKSVHKEGIYNRTWWPSLPSTRPFRSFLSYRTDSGKRQMAIGSRLPSGIDSGNGEDSCHLGVQGPWAEVVSCPPWNHGCKLSMI